MGRKIAGLAKAISVIAKICRIFLIVGFVFVLVLTALIFALPKGAVQVGLNAIVGYSLSPEIFGQIEGAAASSRISVIFDVSDVALYMVAVLIKMIFAFFILWLVGKIAGKMSDKDAPFSGKAENCIIALGILLIVGTVVPQIYTMIVTLFMSVKYGFGTNVSFNMVLDLKLVIYILGYILLYMLYGYGASLEKEKAVLARELSSCACENPCDNGSDENTDSEPDETSGESASEPDDKPDNNENDTENLT